MDAAGTFARLRDVISKLHAKQVVHGGAECFFNAQGHVGGERGLAVEEVGERGAADFENFGRLFYGQAQLLDDLVLMRSPGWGGFFMGMLRLTSGSRSGRYRQRCSSPRHR